jgi:hypothetical protein
VGGGGGRESVRMRRSDMPVVASVLVVFASLGGVCMNCT